MCIVPSGFVRNKWQYDFGAIQMKVYVTAVTRKCEVIEIMQGLNKAYTYLPGGAIVPIIFCVLGFMHGIYRYIRSFKYLYYYYIEHGVVICNMESHVDAVNVIAKKHNLPNSDYFEPHGYVTGLLIIVFFTILGIIVGSLWPASLIIGILTIPNFALRRFAREKRNKAIFEQELKGTKK